MTVQSRGLRCPGGGGNTASTPDRPDFDPGDLDVRVYVVPDDWTPGGFGQAIVSQDDNASDKSWLFGLDATGNLTLRYSQNGTSTTSVTTTDPTGLADGTPRWLRVFLEAATGDVIFYTATLRSNWVEYESFGGSGAVNLHDSSQDLKIAAVLPFIGIVRELEVRVGGKIVANPVFENQPAGTTQFTDSRGNLWSLNGTTEILRFNSFVPTTDQILDLDGVRRRVDRFRFELCDRNYTPIGNLHPDRIGTVPSLDNDTSSNTVRRLRQLKLLPDEAADVNVISDRLRVYMVLQNGIEFRLGSFLWADASLPVRSWGDEQRGELVDPGYILDQPSTRPFGWGRGPMIGLVMIFLSLRAGFELEDIAIIGEEASRGLAEPVAWEPGTTWHRMLTDLCTIVGFAPPWFDRNGRMHLDQPPDPEIDEPSVSYGGGSGGATHIVADSIIRSNDLLAAPNDFAVFDSGTDRLRVGRYQVPASAPHSFANRGFHTGLVESVQGLETQAQANKAAKNLARTRSSAYEWLTFTSTADPRHDTYDVVEALDERWLETAWSLELRSGGRMTHTMKRVTYAI